MKKISLQLNQDYKSFQNGFNATFEGNLIILSGINGSGKSQLMNIISQKVVRGKKEVISASVILDDKTFGATICASILVTGLIASQNSAL